MSSASRWIRPLQRHLHHHLETRPITVLPRYLRNAEHMASLNRSSSSSSPPKPFSWMKRTPRPQPNPSPPQPHHEPTPAENIKLDLDFYGIPKWGWVIFRTAYGPGSDSSWAKLQEVLTSQSTREMTAPDFPREVADALDWVFVSDPASLSSATRHDLRLRFLQWVVSQPRAAKGTPSRYLFFLHVDDEVLASAETPGAAPRWIKLVRCDEGQDLACWYASAAELRESSEEPDGDEGWMRVSTEVLGAYFCTMLGDTSEGFHVYYKCHPDVLEEA
ncbi:hypothetical protein MMYC01_203480 [Madurella mycetomatis]|uniref:Uncharacterized protein n=1 Tax=Madurella mycetomatis TaxID=100816 RepID=A0A175W3W7_9PEZI|nr:hypothetical protein MMYC01_203480 [Madurella mycetomatis]